MLEGNLSSSQLAATGGVLQLADWTVGMGVVGRVELARRFVGRVSVEGQLGRWGRGPTLVKRKRESLCQYEADG